MTGTIGPEGRSAAASATIEQHNVPVMLVISTGLALAVSPIPFLPVVTLFWVLLLPVTCRALLTVRPARWLVLALTVALAASLATDRARNIPFMMSARTVAQLLGFSVFFIAYLWIFRTMNRQLTVIAILAVGCGWLVGVSLFFEPAQGYGIFKYGYAAPVGLVVVGIASHNWIRDRRKTAYAVLIGGTLVMGLADFRSYAFILFASAVLARRRTRREDALPAHSVVRYAWTVVIGGVALTSFAAAASMGVLGTAVAEKWHAQGSNNIEMAIANGRPESSVSIALLPEHLIHGVGSQGRVDATDLAAAGVALARFDEGVRMAILNRVFGGGLSIHSVIAQYWIQAGVLAATPFIFLCLWGVWILARRTFDSRLGPLVPFAGGALIWDLLFSPWSYFTGPIWGLYAAILVVWGDENSNDPGRTATTDSNYSDNLLE